MQRQPGLVADAAGLVPLIFFPFEEIEENDFNLNIPRYVDTFEEEEEFDIDAVEGEIEGLERKLQVVRGEMGRLLAGICR